MRVLAFASQKAGAGKTTLAGHVAVQAQRSGVGSVVVIDVDPEAHLADWCAKRADQPLKHIQTTQTDLLQTIQRLAAEGIDLAIIDTPPAFGHSIEAVLQAADLLAIPTRPYAHDLEAANATAELARQAGKPFVFVVNGAQVDAELAPDVVMTLAQYGPVATTAVPRSLAFVDAMIEGRTVMETGAEQATAASLEALWKYLSKRFPKKGAKSQAGSAAGTAAVSQGLFSTKAPSRKTETLPLGDELPKAEVSATEAYDAAAAAPSAPQPAKPAPRIRTESRQAPVDEPEPSMGGVVRKRRLGRIVLGASLGLVGLIGVGAVIAVNSLDAGTYAELITSAVEDATGRELKIGGDIDVEIGLTPRIVIEKVSFSNPSWSKEPVMAAADRLEVEIRLIPLLFGDVKIKRIVLAGAHVNLEQAADGRANWSFEDAATPAAASPTAEEGGLPEIHQIRIENSTLVYVNQATKERHQADIERLKLASDGLAETLEFDLAAVIDGHPLQASGEIDSLQAVMDGGDLAVDIVVQSGESRLALEGEIEAPYLESDMDIRVEGSGPALADLGRPFGIALSERGPFKISGAVTGGSKQYRIDDLDASIAKSDLKGTASLDMRGARPSFTGVLKSERLDLADIVVEEAESVPAEPDDGRIFSDEKLPFDALKTVDGDLTFDAKSFVSNSVELSDVTGRLVLAKGVATLSPFRAGISGGQLNLSSVIDASGRTPAVTLKTTADGVSGDDLLGLLGLDGVLGGGRADLTLDVRGQGHSLHDLMGGLGGTGHLHMAGGYINNEFARFLLADMTQMIATAGQGGAGVSCLTTIFDAKKGIATSRNTVIDAPGAAIVGTGRINLNKETISMRFEPVAKQLGLSQFAIPVDVVGPLASPNVSTDAVDSAARVVGTTAGLATDNVLGILGDAAGVETGQVSRTVPSCGGSAVTPVSTSTEPADAPVEETAPAESAAPAPVAPAPSSQTATTATSTKKKKAAATSSSGGTLDQAGELIGDVGNSIDGLFQGSTSSDAAEKTNKTNK
jgi:AsmA family protein